MLKRKLVYLSVVLLFMIATLVPTSHVFGQEEITPTPTATLLVEEEELSPTPTEALEEPTDEVGDETPLEEPTATSEIQQESASSPSGGEDTQGTCEGRRASGDGNLIPFCAGEEVYGVDIYLSTGESCTGGNCYLPSAPVAGEVRTGVVNPWDGEVPGGTEPWNPYPDPPDPTATPEPTETEEPVVCEGRRASGDGNLIPFCAGEEVYGVDIYLSTGESCEGGNCYLPSAPVSGEVRTGVINPWDGEVPGGTEPWNPYPPTETPIPTATPTETPTPTQTPPEPTPTETGECQNPQGNHESHPPDGNAWYPQGAWRTVRLWIPGHPTYGSDHKLFLGPSDNVGILNGAGSSWSWNAGCGDIAWENYQAIGDSEVTLQELRNAGLIEEGEPPIETPTPTPTLTPTVTPPGPTTTPEEPVVCNNPDHPESHTPIRGQYWQIGPFDGWTIVEMWTNEPGHDQGLRAYWLQPDETLYFLGGGSLWIWPQGCRDIAWENYQANPLPKVTFDELSAEGLIFEPEACQAPEIHQHDPIQGQYWSIGPFDGWTIIQLWTNEPGYPQDLRVYWLQPGEILNYLGGGTLYIWPHGCRDAAWESYQQSDLPKVTYEELSQEGLVFEPSVCTIPDQPDPHTPIQGQYWQIGPFDGWTIVEMWTNEPGHDQGLRAYWLQPDETLYFLGGGSLWIWPQGCRDIAWENYQANPLPKVTFDELASEGLILLPEEETLEVTNQEATLFTPLDFLEPGTIMPEAQASDETIIVEESPNEVFQAVQNGGNLTIEQPDGTQLDLGIECAQVKWQEDWTILCATSDGELILTDRLKTFERSIVSDVASIDNVSSDGEWIKYTDTQGDTWVVSVHGWHYGHASPDAWWVASAFSP